MVTQIKKEKIAYYFSFKLVSDRKARSDFIKTAMDVMSLRKSPLTRKRYANVNLWQAEFGFH